MSIYLNYLFLLLLLVKRNRLTVRLILRHQVARTSNKKRIVLRSGGGMRRYSRPTVLRLDFLAVNLVSCSCPSSLRIKVIGLPLLFSTHITAMMDEGELIWQMEICTVTTACLTSATTAACLRTTVSTHWCWRHTLENIITILWRF